MSDKAVVLEGVTKNFGPQCAVDRLDLTIPTGSIYGVIGPNGSGKTTTIRMILRIYKPDNGRVVVLGKDHGEAADDRVGYLPEERGLYHRMTVRNVLRYFAQLKGMRRPDQEINLWLERLGATEWANKKIEQLSKGMAQKVQFIAAVAAKPELVILDEPFSGLDPVNMEVLRDAVLELRKNGTTVLFSTHDMDVAERMCDRIFMIYRGKKVLDGELEEIQTQYGEPTLRVRLANGAAISGAAISHALPGVTSVTPKGRFHDLAIESDSYRPTVLRELMKLGDIEHFEMVRPSLHDIFVRIARPTPADASNSVSNEKVGAV